MDEGRPSRRDEPPPIEWIRPDEAPPPAQPEGPPAAWVPSPEEFREPTRAPRPAPGPRPRFGRSGIAGVSLVLAGILGMVLITLLFLEPLTPEQQQAIENLTADQLAANLVFNLFIIYSQPVAVLGGIMAIQHKNWKLALICSSYALVMFVVSLLPGLLAVLGFLLVVTSRNEFTS